jgi:hypothetical protein
LPAIQNRDRNIGTVDKPYFVKENEILELLHDQDLTRKINMYIRSKKWGLPLGPGWMLQPAWIIEVFDILDNIEALYG